MVEKERDKLIEEGDAQYIRQLEEDLRRAIKKEKLENKIDKLDWLIQHLAKKEEIAKKAFELYLRKSFKR